MNLYDALQLCFLLFPAHVLPVAFALARYISLSSTASEESEIATDVKKPVELLCQLTSSWQRTPLGCEV